MKFSRGDLIQFSSKFYTGDIESDFEKFGEYTKTGRHAKHLLEVAKNKGLEVLRFVTYDEEKGNIFSVKDPILHNIDWWFWEDDMELFKK